MSKIRKLIAGGFGLVAIGYALGVLTAPKSGKQTRKQLKEAGKKSVANIERDLKTVYSDTKKTLDKLAKDNPELTAKYKSAKAAAQKSQAKLKNIISALHGEDNVDEDLSKVLTDAKQALSDLKTYLSK